LRYRRAGMTVALQPGVPSAASFELAPGQSLAEHQRLALRDLRGTIALWRLCRTLSWLDIRLRYRGSMLGPLWLTLSTGVMVGAMGFIYSTLFHMDLHEYLPFLAVSQVLWAFLATLVADGCTAFTAAEATIRSVRMPFVLYAARIVLRNYIILGHNALVIVVVFAALSAWPGATVLLALPGLLLWSIDALAIALLLGALCARFRDIPPIVASVMQMTFFVTPVIWKPDQLGSKQWLLPFNPFFTLLQIVRAPLLGEIPSLSTVVSALVSSVVLCSISWLLFARARGRIAFWV